MVKNIFDDMPEEEIAKLYSLGTPEMFAAGNIILHEHTTDDAMYIILDGEAEILKNIHDLFGQPQKQIIATLKMGDPIGEMALLESKPRSATIRAKTALTTLKFDVNLIKENQSVYLTLIKMISRKLSERLRYTNEVTVTNMESSLNQAVARNVLGVFMIVVFWLTGLYTLSLTTLIHLRSYFASSTPLSSLLIIIYAVLITYAMKSTGLGLHRFGVTLDNWKKVSIQAVWYTLPFLLLFLLVKICLVYFGNYPGEVNVFSGYREFGNGQTYLSTLLIYIFLAPIQELITRCALQSTFYLFLPGKHLLFRKWNAIFLSNLIFSAAHSHINLTFAFVTFVPGLFWGWLFHKQKSIVGVSVSHILLGVWVLFVVGVKEILVPTLH